MKRKHREQQHGIRITNANSNRYHNTSVLYGGEDINYQYEPQTEDYYNEINAFAISECLVSNAFGYVFDSTPVRGKVTAVNHVIDLYRPGLLSGIVDIDTFLPEFIDKLIEAGIQDIINENQRQYDVWRENNSR